MKWKILICSLLMAGMIARMTPVTDAHPAWMNDQHKPECKQDIQLTSEQSKTLDALAGQVFASHKALWEKMGEYRILTQDQVDRRVTFMKKHLEQMKKHQYQWCKHEHDRD